MAAHGVFYIVDVFHVGLNSAMVSFALCTRFSVASRAVRKSQKNTAYGVSGLFRRESELRFGHLVGLEVLSM